MRSRLRRLGPGIRPCVSLRPRPYLEKTGAAFFTWLQPSSVGYPYNTKQAPRTKTGDPSKTGIKEGRMEQDTGKKTTAALTAAKEAAAQSKTRRYIFLARHLGLSQSERHQRSSGEEQEQRREHDPDLEHQELSDILRGKKKHGI